VSFRGGLVHLRAAAAVAVTAITFSVTAMTVSVHAASAAAVAPTRRVWVQGDSVLLGAVSTVQAELQGAGWIPTVTAFGGLQLVAAIDLFRQEQANLGSVVVIELGNNFCCDIAQFGPQIDEAMAAIGARHVIWLTTSLFEPRQQQINALLRAGAARWPNAEVADWAGEVAANPRAVGPDGLHLTVAGRVLLSSFIHAHLDAWYRQFSRPSRPVVDGFGAAPSDGPSGQQTTSAAPAGLAPTPDGKGYWTLASDGTVDTMGDAAPVGPTAPQALSAPAVGIATAPGGGGYWLVTSAGAVLAFGSASLHGTADGMRLKQPIVGMAATPGGGGYWLVAADGGVFAFGDAAFYGSTGGLRLNQPVVGMAATADGRGYWLVAADGGVFSFGDARYFGSTGAVRLNQPVQSMAATADGHGYWLLAADGGVFTFGDAHYFGSPAKTAASYVAISSTPRGDGYWLLGST
jgi:hypothetical protein